MPRWRTFQLIQNLHQPIYRQISVHAGYDKSGKEQYSVLYIQHGGGEQDPRIEPTRKLVQTFKEKGLKVELASFPGNHEWQVWRKSLNDFAQKLFK